MNVYHIIALSIEVGNNDKSCIICNLYVINLVSVHGILSLPDGREEWYVFTHV